MNNGEHITVEMLTDYALGILSFDNKMKVQEALVKDIDLQKELAIIEQSLENYAIENYSLPPVTLTKEKVWQYINSKELPTEIDLTNTPILDNLSDATTWLKAIKPLIPTTATEDLFVHELRNDGKVFQALVVSKIGYPDEVHDDCNESFLLLEGYCTCVIGEDEINMSPGDYMQIPMHTHHDVRSHTPRVVAILQRIAV
jgi:mannose-6-phosphate isomerase-like protein (cupin superfamily)